MEQQQPIPSGCYKSLVGFILMVAGVVLIIRGTWLFGGLLTAFGFFLALYAITTDAAKQQKGKEDDNPNKSVTHPSPGMTLEVTMGEDDLEEYSVKGINFAGLTDSLIGDHVGYVRALTSNEHDPYAIGVYVGRKRVGHLPRGNQELHAKITEKGGSVDAYIHIGKLRDEEDGHYFYYGKVKPII